MLLCFILPFLSLAQDPSCEFMITLKDIDHNKYDYNILLDYGYEKKPIKKIKKILKIDWKNYYNDVKCAILKADNNKAILVGYSSNYCYPNGSKEQLRVIVARKKKKGKKVKLMYASTDLLPRSNEIIISKFKKGKRKTNVYTFKEVYPSKSEPNYNQYKYRSLHSRKIYIN